MRKRVVGEDVEKLTVDFLPTVEETQISATYPLLQGAHRSAAHQHR